MANYPVLQEGVNMNYIPELKEYIVLTNKQSNRLKEEEKEVNHNSTDPKKKKEGEGKGEDNKVGKESKKINFSFSKGKKKQGEEEKRGRVEQECEVVRYKKGEWSRVDTGKHKGPCQRMFYYSCYQQPYLFIYGGVGVDQKIIQDLFGFHLVTQQWRRFYFMEGPTPRMHGQLVGDSSQQVMYLLGGVTQPENYLQKDLWQLSLDQVVWDDNTYELPGVQWQQVNVHNLQGLKGHSAFLLDSNYLVVFGGFNQQGQPQNTLQLIDIFAGTIEVIQSKGDVPSPRGYQQWVMVKPHLYALFGGITQQPTHSTHHNTTNNYNSYSINNYTNNNSINNIQNEQNTSCLNDFYLYDSRNCHWSQPKIGGQMADARYSCVLVSNQQNINNQLIIMGGIGREGKVAQDIYLLEEKREGEEWELKGKTEGDEQEIGEQEEMEQLQEARDREGLMGGQIHWKEAGGIQGDKATEQLSKADHIIHQQAIQIQAREHELKEARALIRHQHHLYSTLHTQHSLTLQQQQAQLQQLQQDIQLNQQAFQANQAFYNKQVQLYNNEKKKRKLETKKCQYLQEAMRYSENFVISLDQFYTQGLRQDSFNNIIREDIFNQIQQNKYNHKKILYNFSNKIKEFYQKENTIKDVIKQQKQKNTPEQIKELKQAYISNLNERELKIFEK